jgi:hypothetical protein
MFYNDHLKSLIGYDEAELDDIGNIELCCWAGALGGPLSPRRTAGRQRNALLSIAATRAARFRPRLRSQD